MKTISDLQIGKAGEYLVCADLIIKGLVAFPSEQGLPFDVVMSIDGLLYKVQVKTTRRPKNTPQRKTDIPAYIFHIGNNGKNNRRKKYGKNEVDIFALVCLETKEIAYIPFFDCQTTMNFRVPKYKGMYHDEQAVVLKEKVMTLKNNGISCEQISKELNLSLSNTYRYSSNTSIDQKGSNAGIYFDTLTLDKCLASIERVKRETAQMTLGV